MAFAITNVCNLIQYVCEFNVNLPLCPVSKWQQNEAVGSQSSYKMQYEDGLCPHGVYIPCVCFQYVMGHNHPWNAGGIILAQCISFMALCTENVNCS